MIQQIRVHCLFVIKLFGKRLHHLPQDFSVDAEKVSDHRTVVNRFDLFVLTMLFFELLTLRRKQRKDAVPVRKPYRFIRFRIVWIALEIRCLQKFDEITVVLPFTVAGPIDVVEVFQ